MNGEAITASGVIVFGATGPTGRLVMTELRARGSPVAAVLRSDAGADEIAAEGIEVLRADAMQPGTLPPILTASRERYPILLNLLGGNPFAEPETWPDHKGVVNVTNAACAAGYRRYILVTSVGTGESWQYVPESAAYIKPIIELKTLAEAHLKATELDWTIIKPGGLGPPDYEIPRGRPLITENHGVRGLIDRHDLADVVLRVLAADARITAHRELYAVADRIEHHAGSPAVFSEI